MKLVLIEGPAKRETIKKYLGSDFEVFATKGHIRDLPVKTLGVDVQKNYNPTYEIIQGKEDLVKQLKQKGFQSRKKYILQLTLTEKERLFRGTCLQFWVWTKMLPFE